MRISTTVIDFSRSRGGEKLTALGAVVFVPEVFLQRWHVYDGALGEVLVVGGSRE